MVLDFLGLELFERNLLACQFYFQFFVFFHPVSVVATHLFKCLDLLDSLLVIFFEEFCSLDGEGRL